jgi:hypothetical protein
MKLDGRIDSSQDKKDVSHQKYDRPIQAGTKRGQSVAATVRSGLRIRLTERARRSRPGPTTRKPQSPSGPFATKR